MDSFGENLANLVEGLDISDWIGPWGASDRALIDHDDIINLPVSDDFVVVIGLGGILLFASAEGCIECVLYQRTFARTAYTGNEAE